MVLKSLDIKLARLHADPHGCKDFILADAKDADMALAIGAPGRSPEAHSGELRYRSLSEFRDLIVQIVEQKLVDIMLMSASTSEALTIQRRLFDNSSVTPAARANDTTDIHIVRGSKYPTSPSLPFRTATLDHLQCGHLDCRPEERTLGVDLGLYSITFNNDTVLDRVALFGRKINNAENQLAFIRFLRLIADGQIGPEEAVKAYHGVLQQLRIKPHRPLEKDMELQTNVMSYGGNGVVVSAPATKQEK